MTSFFDAVVVSGQFGYRKPHPRVFLELLDQLGTSKEQTAFVGDNLEADIHGARQMGIQPIWMTYVQSQKALEALGPADPQPLPHPASPPSPTGKIFNASRYSVAATVARWHGGTER